MKVNVRAKESHYLFLITRPPGYKQRMTIGNCSWFRLLISICIHQITDERPAAETALFQRRSATDDFT